MIYIALASQPLKTSAMNGGDDTWFLHWLRFSVDVLIAAATFAVVFAAIGTTADVLYLLLIPGRLIGIESMLEPHVAAAPARDIGPQALRLATESKPARPGLHARERFDAPIVDAASV